jgi:hypothetical protein
MDLEVIAKLLERAVVSLELDAPLHPWWQGEVRPRRAVRLSRLLASPCPRGPEVGSPVDLEPRLLEAFLPEDRDAVASQIEDGYRHLIVLSDETEEPVDDAPVVHVQLGLPLIGRDRILLRVCTSNLSDDAEMVTGDHHAWLDPSGALPGVLSQPQRDLASLWNRWVVGRSPGLRIDVNTARESELLSLPGIELPTVHAILAARPFESVDHLRDVIGPETLMVIGRLVDWNALRSR